MIGCWRVSYFSLLLLSNVLPSVLWHCWLVVRKSPASKKLMDESKALKETGCWFVDLSTPTSGLNDADITQQTVAICPQPSHNPKPTVDFKNCSYVCVSLCTTVVHNIAGLQNSSDNLSSYPPDRHHCSDVVYRRRGINVLKLRME